LDFDIVAKFLAVIDSKPASWEGFITSNGCHLGHDIAACEATTWREAGPSVLHGVEYDYTSLDSGVWMARRQTYERVGGFDESLFAWGHAQTEFQYRVYTAGVEFVRVPEVLFYHPQHSAERDMDLAHQQLRERGLDIRKLWERYDGPRIY
jgi:GT2 family glycosyltransferase